MALVPNRSDSIPAVNGFHNFISSDGCDSEAAVSIMAMLEITRYLPACAARGRRCMLSHLQMDRSRHFAVTSDVFARDEIDRYPRASACASDKDDVGQLSGI